MRTDEGSAGGRTPYGQEPSRPLLTVAVHTELDVIASRLRARQIAALCGFGNHDQTRVATAVSEMARNAVTHASGGKVHFFLGMSGRGPALLIRVEDQGPGMSGARGGADVESDAVHGGGIAAARRFMDTFEIATSGHGARGPCRRPARCGGRPPRRWRAKRREWTRPSTARRWRHGQDRAGAARRARRSLFRNPAMVAS